MNELERLCVLNCTDEELAAWFGVTTRTIERRRLEPAFAQVMERGKAKGRISIRRMQVRLLEQGNATMGVWLGKQLLGQTDQLSFEMRGQPVLIVIPSTPPNALEGQEDEFEGGVTIDVGHLLAPGSGRL